MSPAGFGGARSGEDLLADYAAVTGAAVVDHLRQLASVLGGVKVVHVNSTRSGGGVAEILAKLIPLKQALGIDARWEVLRRTSLSTTAPRRFHNGLQGVRANHRSGLRPYEETNEENAARLRDGAGRGRFRVHPRPAAGGACCARCPRGRESGYGAATSTSAGRTDRCGSTCARTWLGYDASIFSLPEFAQRTAPSAVHLIPPSIDPFSEKNRELGFGEVDAVLRPLRPGPGAPPGRAGLAVRPLQGPGRRHRGLSAGQEADPAPARAGRGRGHRRPGGGRRLGRGARAAGGRSGYPRAAAADRGAADDERAAAGGRHRDPEVACARVSVSP